jgi:Flp pilus assembly protein TadG
MDDMNFLAACSEWLFSKERRASERRAAPRLVAHYWNGATPMARPVQDFSSTGLFLKTDDRWYPGTQIVMSLQRTDCPESDPNRTISVNAAVVRRDAEGLGFHFLPTVAPKSRVARKMSLLGADKKTLQNFLRHVHADEGQALIEYLLVVPLIFLLIVNVVNFGGLFFAWITVANAARAAGDYAIMGGVSIGYPRQANAAQITALITQDVSSLPNTSSLVVNICQNNNGTITTLSGTCSSVPSDPETGSFVLTSIDLTYTYQPLLGTGFKFPGLNIYASLPPTTVHQKALMRNIQ